MRIRGVTLIETVVAATLLSLGILVALSLLPATHALTNRGRFRIYALSLAQSLIEEQRQRPWGSISSLPYTYSPEPTVMQGTGTVFTPSVEVLAVPGQSSDQLRKVRVTVNWKERTGSQQVQHESTLARVPRF